MITTEGGIGRGLQPLTGILNKGTRTKQGGTPLTTYAPAYTFSTSRRRGFTLGEHTELGIVDFKALDSFGISLWKTDSMSIQVVKAPKLKDVVTGLTSIIGRMKSLPKWTQQGAIVGIQGGQDKVVAAYEFLKNQSVPMKAVWMQDWVGTEVIRIEGERLLWNWKLNRTHYYDWENMTASWAADGVKPMVYMNPFFANLSNIELEENQFEEGDKNGWFLKNDKNKSLIIYSGSIPFCMVDLTNPEAANWTQNIIINNMIKEAGAVGWMADFSEYAPLTANFMNAEKGSVT